MFFKQIERKYLKTTVKWEIINVHGRGYKGVSQLISILSPKIFGIFFYYYNNQ
jgi:hypothetical protein